MSLKFLSSSFLFVGIYICFFHPIYFVRASFPCPLPSRNSHPRPHRSPPPTQLRYARCVFIVGRAQQFYLPLSTRVELWPLIVCFLEGLKRTTSQWKLVSSASGRRWTSRANPPLCWKTSVTRQVPGDERCDKVLPLWKGK